VAVVGHSMGSVLALHLAANTDLCQSAVFLNGLGIIPHRSVNHCHKVCFKHTHTHTHTQSQCVKHWIGDAGRVTRWPKHALVKITVKGKRL